MYVLFVLKKCCLMTACLTVEGICLAIHNGCSSFDDQGIGNTCVTNIPFGYKDFFLSIFSEILFFSSDL